MTMDAFMEEVKGYWSWLYDGYISKLFERQWRPWELLAIAGVLSLFLVWKVMRRRRKAAATIAQEDHVLVNSAVVGVKPTRRWRIGGKSEVLDAAQETTALQIQQGYERWTVTEEESDWPSQPVRELRREIIKRDRCEARLEREIRELTVANEQLEREVAGLTVANKRLMRKIAENRRIEAIRR